MNCGNLTNGVLVDFTENILAPQVRAQVAAHLNECPNCRARLAKLSGAVGAMAQGQTWDQLQPTGVKITQGSSGEAQALSEDAPLSILDRLQQKDETFGQIMERQLKRSPWWLISIGLHGILLFLTTLIIIETPQTPDESRRVIQADMPPKVEKQYDPEVKRDIEENKKDIPQTDPTVTEKSEVVPLENVEVSDHFEADTDSDFQEMLDADPDNKLLADRSGDVGSFTGIGIGGGSGGAFGTRGRGGRKWLVKRGGGSTRTESATDAALEWLKRHETLLPDKNAEGNNMGVWLQVHWDMECAEYGGTYAEPAKFPGKCPNYYPKALAGAQGIDPDKVVYLNKCEAAHDIAITGLGLLTFAGAGFHHKRGKYKATIQNAVNFVVWMTQMGDKVAPGDIGKINGTESAKVFKKAMERHPAVKAGQISSEIGVDAGMYNHHCVTLGLLEIYGVSRDAYLKDTCLALLRAVVRAQNGTGAWRYQYNSGDADMSVSTWGVMAVKAGKAVGLLEEACKAEGKEEGTVIKQVKDWVDKMYIPNQGYSYVTPGASGGETWALGLADIAFLYSGDEMKKKMEPTVKWFCDYLITNHMFDGAPHENYVSKTTDIPDSQWLKFDYPDGMKVQLETLNGAKEVDLTTFQNLPKYVHISQYSQYYMTLALFQYGGPTWKVWNHLNSRWLVANQAQGKKQCADGSWEICTNGYFLAYASVPLSTCFNALQLQVYYRYKKHADEKAKAKK